MLNFGETIHIVGAGLAGSECALQLASLGYRVHLYEMRGIQMTPAHKSTNCAELVCSNSFGSFARFSAPGQLKWEAEQLGSKILEAAFQSHVPAGQALGIDRDLFAERVTLAIDNHPLIKKEFRIINSIDELPRPLIIATGPLTHDLLAQSLQNHFDGQFLYFFDAIAPIIDADSLDLSKIWRADRWDKGIGEGDYLNCPMDKETYYHFIREINNARKIESKEFEKTPYFESCMPIEEMIRRGEETPRFGPMSPKGLDDPKTGRWPYAVVQLRQENKMATAYNMVGFQTKMAYSEQKRIFRMIPGLENAEFLKLGSIHRNLYINSPQLLNADLSSKKDPLLFFAGQITGVEGYFESTCIGMLVARALHEKLNQRTFQPPPLTSALGAIWHALTDLSRPNFQPTNINLGLFPPSEQRLSKHDKKIHHTERARGDFTQWSSTQPVFIETEKFCDSIALELMEEKDKAALSDFKTRGRISTQEMAAVPSTAE